MNALRTGLALLALTALPTPVAAQEEEAAEEEATSEDDARHHFRLGEAHYESGHFREAAEEFEHAYRLSQRPALLHNIYVAYRDAGELVRAADALRRFIEVGQVDNDTILRRRLAELERLIAEGADGEGDAPAATPQPEDTLPVDPPETSDGGPSPIGWALLGIGGATLVAGAITGGVALSVNDELASTCPNLECPADYDFESRTSTGSALALTTDILLPVGAVVVATSVILLLVLRESGEDVGAAAMCGPEGCSVAVGARF